ncbi:hypothetical protein FGB62_16g258 [Gracilaria domingensis]|nr:hypothetical protein FGB62_16g258 [Gracilaria domingensis]
MKPAAIVSCPPSNRILTTFISSASPLGHFRGPPLTTVCNPVKLDGLKVRRKGVCPAGVPLQNHNGSDKSLFRIPTSAKKTSSTSPVVKVVGFLLIGGLLFSAVQPLLRAGRATDALLDAKLGKIPVFTVTDSTGRPFLSETDDGRLRRGFFFIQPADAEKYLEKVLEQSEDAKVLAIGLNEAIKFLDIRTGPAKSVPETFELFPDDHEAALADELTQGAFQRNFGENGIPVFYLDGLAIKDDLQDAPVYPLFFAKEKLDETLNELKKKDPSALLDIKDLQIIDLKQTIREIKSNSNSKLSRVIFIPLDESMKRLRASTSP